MKKTFDCVEMKRAAAGKLAETLAGMSRQEELAFRQDRTRQWQVNVPLTGNNDLPYGLLSNLYHPGARAVSSS